MDGCVIVDTKFEEVEVRNCCPGVANRTPVAGFLVSAVTGLVFSSEESFSFVLKQKQRIATIQYQIVSDVFLFARGARSWSGYVCWNSTEG